MLPEIQHFYENAMHDEIPSGFEYLMWLILKHSPANSDGRRGEMLDAGSGPGKMSKKLREVGFTPYAYDLSGDAIAELSRSRNIFPYQTDLRIFGNNLQCPEISNVEKMPRILFNAVMSSVPYKQVLPVAYVYLEPKGKIFLGDFVAADRPYRELGRPTDWGIDKWRKRYKKNYEAFVDIGLPYRGFMVTKPGERKLELDWCSDKSILNVIWQRRNEMPGSHEYAGLFERFAHHFDTHEFEQYVEGKLGLKILDKHMGQTKSRNPRGGSSPVAYYVLEKGDEYLFDPMRLGLSIEKDDVAQIYHERMRATNPRREHTIYYRKLLERLKIYGIKAPEIMARAKEIYLTERRTEEYLKFLGKI